MQSVASKCISTGNGGVKYRMNSVCVNKYDYIVYTDNGLFFECPRPHLKPPSPPPKNINTLRKVGHARRENVLGATAVVTGRYVTQTVALYILMVQAQSDFNPYTHSSKM